METSHRFQRGDLVVHPNRKDWGQGVVKDASPISHQGTQAQRLAVEFANRGRVVINTAVAPLLPKEHSDPMSRSSSTNSGGGWLSQLEKATGNATHELWDLPDALTDPFASVAKRLDATLDTYRFSSSPRGLIDWAVLQTGLDDPLSKYTRHELEQAFPRFARDRDQHLVSLVRQLKRSNEQATLNAALQNSRLPAAARAALTKAMK